MVKEGKRRFGEDSAKVNHRPRSATFGNVENSGVMNDRYCKTCFFFLENFDVKQFKPEHRPLDFLK